MNDLESFELPRMMTIREVAKTGILPEYALRTLVKQKKIPFLKCGSRVYINYGKLVSMLSDLGAGV